MTSYKVEVDITIITIISTVNVLSSKYFECFTNTLEGLNNITPLMALNYAKAVIASVSLTVVKNYIVRITTNYRILKVCSDNI